jgi:choline dehydrogenase
MLTNPDYIIIGAGAAGCVLANRLSARADVKVVLLEAGGSDKRTEIQVPAAFSKLFKSDVDWNYITEPQEHCNGRRMYWPRGRVLGGSSSINAMIYIRGHAHIYDHWAALGNTGWSYADLLPYFKKAEHQERGADTYHGSGGAINVADPRDPNRLSKTFIAAGKSLGIPENKDFNGATQEGVGLFQVTQKNGARHSVASAYLVPALKRPNLQVVTNAHVTHLRFEGKKAVGVSYKVGNERLEIRCQKEMLLCGGAINSPQLLLLSGIGKGADLQNLGIRVVADVAGVGQNLQDHLLAGVMWASTQPITLATAETPLNLAKYLLFRKGALSSNVAEAGGFVRIDPTAPIPDLQFHFAPSYYVEHGFKNPTGHGFAIGATLVQPYSRGTIKLHTPDPIVHPAIQPNYYADERDMQTMIDGCRLARRLGESTPFAPYRGEEVFPGKAISSESDLRTFIQGISETLYHPVGTCKMGTDPLAVVNPRLQVQGIAGLRVVDASVMPLITNGNTQAPTVAIAEKAADMILQTL